MKVEDPVEPEPEFVGTPEEQAEQMKNAGNNFLREGKLADAVKLYTLAIEQCKSEGLFTNRAMANIKLGEFKKALFDCD